MQNISLVTILTMPIRIRFPRIPTIGLTPKTNNVFNVDYVWLKKR